MKEVSAFVTPELFQYCVMLFGMKNVPTTFQRMMNSVICGLKGYDAYIDNIVVYSATWEDHVQQLRDFFTRLRDAQLTINLVKSEFCQARVVFLGHVVGQGEVAQDKECSKSPFFLGSPGQAPLVTRRIPREHKWQRLATRFLLMTHCTRMRITSHS